MQLYEIRQYLRENDKRKLAEMRKRRRALRAAGKSPGEIREILIAEFSQFIK